jgi:excisionase family DNA binding protein
LGASALAALAEPFGHVGGAALAGFGVASLVAGDGPRLAYTANQAARALGLPKSMIYDQLRSRRPGSVRVGRRWIITRQQIDAWLASLPSEPPEP